MNISSGTILGAFSGTEIGDQTDVPLTGRRGTMTLLLFQVQPVRLIIKQHKNHAVKEVLPSGLI